MGWVFLILILTLFPEPPITSPPEDLPSVLCLVCGERGAADGILNVLLFIPLGTALLAATGHTLRAMAVIVTLTVVIEVLQGSIPGRYQTLGDVAYNAGGGGLGVALGMTGGLLLRPARRAAAALTLATGAAAGGLYFLAGILLTPSFPATVYYGQWTADLHYMEAYDGQVIESWLGDMFLGSEKAANPQMAVSLLRSGGPLKASVVAGTAPPALAPIVSILDESAVEIVVLGADATDLVLRVRYRANDLRLDRPDLRARRALAATQPGDTITLRAERTSEAYTLRLNEQAFTPLRHTPGEGWALLLHPGRTAPWVDAALNIGWVAGLLVLAGWWAPGVMWGAAAFTLAVSGMAFAAIAGPLMTMAVVEVLAAFGGLMLGATIRRTLTGVA